MACTSEEKTFVDYERRITHLSLCLSYLSSLGDLACGSFLLYFSLPVPGFLQGPLPGQHGFDGLFDWPTINLLVLTNRKRVQQLNNCGKCGNSGLYNVHRVLLMFLNLTFSENVL